jgi:hypothetical protein
MLTVLAVFNDRTDPAPVLRSLVESSLDVGRAGLVWREKTVRKVEDIEIVTYVDHFGSPKEEAKKGAVGGLIGGAGTVAAGAVLASAGFFSPDLVSITLLPLATAAAAAGGGLTGGAIGALLGATDHDATQVKSIEQEEVESVERIGFVLSVEVESDPEAVAAFLSDQGADDVTVLDSEGSQIRIHLDLTDEPDPLDD